MGNYTPKVAVFAHPTDAAGTKGDFEGETTSIETSFYFHPLKTRELHKIMTEVITGATISREYKKGERDGF